MSIMKLGAFRHLDPQSAFCHTSIMKSFICTNQRKAKRQKALESQVNRLGHRITKLHDLNRCLSWYCLLIFLIGGALVFISFFWISKNLAWFFAGTAFIIFSIIAWYHRRLEKGIRRHQIWMEIKESQIARMDLDWEKIPGSMAFLFFIPKSDV